MNRSTQSKCETIDGTVDRCTYAKMDNSNSHWRLQDTTCIGPVRSSRQHRARRLRPAIGSVTRIAAFDTIMSKADQASRNQASSGVAVVISYDHAEKFKKAGIDNPADYCMGKKLRVTGKVIAENDQVRIRADDPADQDRGRREVSSRGNFRHRVPFRGRYEKI